MAGQQGTSECCSRERGFKACEAGLSHFFALKPLQGRWFGRSICTGLLTCPVRSGPTLPFADLHRPASSTALRSRLAQRMLAGHLGAGPACSDGSHPRATSSSHNLAGEEAECSQQGRQEQGRDSDAGEPCRSPRAAAPLGVSNRGSRQEQGQAQGRGQHGVSKRSRHSSGGGACGSGGGGGGGGGGGAGGEAAGWRGDPTTVTDTAAELAFCKTLCQELLVGGARVIHTFLNLRQTCT